MSKGTLLSHIISKLQMLTTMKQAGQAQAFITKSGLHNHPSVLPKLISFSSLSQSGCLTHAQMIFQETPMDNPFVCNIMIRAYTRSVFPLEAILTYNQMHRKNVKRDHFTYTFALKACARALFCTEEDDGFRIDLKGKEIHCGLLKAGLDQDHFVGNSLVYMYCQCGSLGFARQVFDEMTEKTIASWNIMIFAYNQINDFASADSLLNSMPMKNVVSWNTLIARHLRSGNVEAADRVFHEMPERDAVSWNSMIAGYVQIKEYTGALNLFAQMHTANVQTTEITLISILGACAETGSLAVGRKIHESLKQKHVKIEGYLANALVDMYVKCGNMNWAWEAFNELKMKHVSCWNAMIVGLAVHGHSEMALNLFSAMEMSPNEVRPNRITFIGVLIACSHKGLVDEGRKFFSRMIHMYKITPDMKHYGCMVDLFSRWGFLNEALKMIKAMPFKANSVLWRTLLGACRVHGNVELAEESFRQLGELEPLQDGDYVLLSNVYAEADRWNDVERVRDKMIHSGVVKNPGSSHIGLK